METIKSYFNYYVLKRGTLQAWNNIYVSHCPYALFFKNTQDVKIWTLKQRYCDLIVFVMHYLVS